MWHYEITDQYGWTSEYSADQTDNASEIWNTLVSVYGWTENAASAVIGNMQAESALNPGQWEHNHEGDFEYGFGLGQWTPATKVSDYVGSKDVDKMADGGKQLLLLLNRPSQYSTYYLNPDGSSTYYNEIGLPYIDNMEDFSHSTASREDLTKLWAICWERPGSSYYQSSIGGRISHANHWYDTFDGTAPIPPTPIDPPTPDDVEAFITAFFTKRRKKKLT